MKQQYFARFGKVFGPYTDEEVSDMQALGKLKEFTWVWDAAKDGWRALDAAPPPLRSIVETPKPLTPRTVPLVTDAPLEVICHNRQEYVSGALHCLTETGCEFVSAHPEGHPVFGDNAFVLLNLFDRQSGQLQNVRAKVCSVARLGGGWMYQLRWQERPSFAQ